MAVVKAEAKVDQKGMVNTTESGAKMIDWSVVSKEVTEMKEKLVEVHGVIHKIWKAEKCRDLATLESITRNVVEYLNRLPAAAAKFGSKTVATGGQGTSLLSKPR